MNSLASHNNGLIVLVDDLPFRRAGLANILTPWALSEGLSLKAVSLNELMSCEISMPQMYILSISGECIAGDAFLKALSVLRSNSPLTPLCIFSDSSDASSVRLACTSGVDAYIPTNLEPSTALKALSFVVSGGKFFPPESLLSIDSRNMPGKFDEARGPFRLTQRQNEIIDALRFGHSNKIIARRLNIAEATVKIHIRQIMRKLGVQNRTQVALAVLSNAERGISIVDASRSNVPAL
jgi:DNA-binding NarL/FixJ family response regulator